MGRPKLTEQYCIQRLEEKGYKFIEWSEPYKGSLTKAHIVLHCGHNSTGDYTSLVQVTDTKICMKCAQYNRRIPASVRIEQIESKGITFLNWIGEYKSLRTKVQTKCNKGHISTYELCSILCKGCICQQCAIENLPGGYCETNFTKNDSLKNTKQFYMFCI